ncbi:MAG: hypothetical protein IJ094_09370 [Bacilli bacterium]|nr:hypothetical protein [Bacilli bacterium]
MIGTIERIKNSVLLKCSTLNDKIIKDTLSEIIDTRIYRFSEELSNMINNLIDEKILRNNVSDIIKKLIFKKIKRKLFIDSLALQITNDTYIESYFNNEIDINSIESKYLKELNDNKNSNQLNMTENLNLDEIINDLRIYVDGNVISLIKENNFLVNSIKKLLDDFKLSLESDLESMINDLDKKYKDILLSEIKDEKEEKEEVMINNEGDEEEVRNNYEIEENNVVSDTSKFDKYDDMTLFNKMILSLNTKEERLSRKEDKLHNDIKEMDERLSITNKNIEANIERENKLSQRKLELNSKEVEINSKLSEAEVIFLNMKPLIKGLNKIKDASINGGSNNE